MELVQGAIRCYMHWRMPPRIDRMRSIGMMANYLGWANKVYVCTLTPAFLLERLTCALHFEMGNQILYYSFSSTRCLCVVFTLFLLLWAIV